MDGVLQEVVYFLGQLCVPRTQIHRRPTQCLVHAHASIFFKSTSVCGSLEFLVHIFSVNSAGFFHGKKQISISVDELTHCLHGYWRKTIHQLYMKLPRSCSHTTLYEVAHAVILVMDRPPLVCIFVSQFRSGVRTSAYFLLFGI